MKALTLYQPWATLIAIGAKKIETRSWQTSYRGPLAIHASMEGKYITWRDVRSKHYLCDKEPFYSVLMDYYHSMPALKVLKELFPKGAIVAICELVSCFRIPEDHSYALMISDQEKAFGDYTPGRFMWMLDKVQKLEIPILVKGARGLWEWNETPHQ